MHPHPAPGLALLLCLVAGTVVGEGATPMPVAPAAPVIGPEFATDLVLIERQGSQVHLRLLARRRNHLDWLRLADEAEAIADSFTRWYGPCAWSDIWVIDASETAVPDSSAPGVVFLNRRPVPFTRMQERELCRLLAQQWFPAAAEDSAAWFAQGLAAHAVSRYLESSYGPTNLLDLPFRVPQLSGLGEDYLERVLHYVAASNDLLQPLHPHPLPPPQGGGNRREGVHPPLDATGKNRGSFLESEMRTAQAGLLIDMLRQQFGPDTFDQALRFCRETGGAAGTSLPGFIRALSLASRRNVFWMLDRWQHSSGTCDYAVTGVKTRGGEVEIGLQQVGAIPMPVEVELRYRDGTSERYVVDSLTPGQPVGFPLSGGLKQVVLDPDRKLLESDRWNNYWPRRVEVKPVFGLPSLEAYQLFYGPYAWYDNYHGFQFGAWAQGRRFVVAGPLRGRHMWTLSETYSTKIDDWHTGASYITPLDFVSDRLRVSFLGDYSLMAAGIRLSLLQEFGRGFGTPNGLVDFGYRYFDLYNLTGRDTVAWELARTAEVRVRLLHSWQSGSIAGGQYLYLGRGLTRLGGNYSYWKASIEENCSVRLAGRVRFSLRLFCGAIPGCIPAQDQLYLSGGLQPSSTEPVSWGLKGMSSAQEHWHYDADVNCRGFAGQYLHGRLAYGVNAHLYALPLLTPFFDVGNVGSSLDEPGFRRPRMDAGVRLTLGPFYADFPFWRWSQDRGHEFAFRWMLGLKLGSGPGV